MFQVNWFDGSQQRRMSSLDANYNTIDEVLQTSIIRNVRMSWTDFRS